MKQTLLSFGGKATKSSKKIPVCSCVHDQLHTIRTCKRCYTIAALRKRCTSTISATTGQSLGTYGTKEELLTRLIKNLQLRKNGNVSEGKFVLFDFNSAL